MTYPNGHDQCVECGAPANHRLVCPVHEPDYRDVLVDDVDPSAREPANKEQTDDR